MKCTVHDLEVMGSNPVRVELRMLDTSILRTKYITDTTLQTEYYLEQRRLADFMMQLQLAAIIAH